MNMSSRSGAGVRPAVGRRLPAQLLAAAAHLRAAVGCAATRGGTCLQSPAAETRRHRMVETIMETTLVIASVR